MKQNKQNEGKHKIPITHSTFATATRSTLCAVLAEFVFSFSKREPENTVEKDKNRMQNQERTKTKEKTKNSHNKFRKTDPGILYCFGATRGHSKHLLAAKFTRRNADVYVALT